MSHFAVLVIGDEPEKQLAPFQENNCGDCPPEYLEFHDVEDEYREEYETDTRHEFYCSSNSSGGIELPVINWGKIADLKEGEKATIYIEKLAFCSYLKKNGKYRSNNPIKTLSSSEDLWFEVTDIIRTSHPDPEVCFEGIVEIMKIAPPREVPMKEYYPEGFESFIKEWAGYEKDPKTGKYGYYENPSAKWDWYQLGGRFTGFFKMISSEHFVDGVIGTPGLMTDRAKVGYADQAIISNIDFDGMRREAEENASWRFETLKKTFGGEIPKIEISWDELLDGEKYKDWDIDKKREAYHSQEAVKRAEFILQSIDEMGLSEKEKNFLRWADIADYQLPKEEYIKNCGSKSYQTFAVLKDGKWYERGSMGWWGFISDKKVDQEWASEFNKLLESLSDDTLLSVYDCHI